MFCWHKWKQHKRFGEGYVWPGIPCRGWFTTGLETCTKCGKRVRGRRDFASWVCFVCGWVFYIAFGVFLLSGTVYVVKTMAPEVLHFLMVAWGIA